MYLSHSVTLYYTSVEFPGKITVNRDTGENAGLLHRFLFHSIAIDIEDLWCKSSADDNKSTLDILYNAIHHLGGSHFWYVHHVSRFTHTSLQ